MNGPISMYKLKPVVQFADPVDLSPTMYRMKNIYSSDYFSSTQGNKEDFQRSLPNILVQKPSEIEILEKRQQTILKRLNNLKEEMSVLKEELGKNSLNSSLKKNMSSSQKTVIHQSLVGVPDEVVLHASPDHPPYSLLAVSRLWPGLSVQVTCHSHSSLISPPSHLSVFNSLATSPHLRVRLIWKQMGPDCELVVSPLSHTPIHGEANLLRYIHRSLTSNADVDPVTETQLDNVLDTCHRLRHARTQRDRQLAMRALNARLGKNEWLTGEELSIADVAAWSVLRAVAGAELSQNLTKWHGRCAATIGQEVA